MNDGYTGRFSSLIFGRSTGKNNEGFPEKNKKATVKKCFYHKGNEYVFINE